MHVPGWCAGAEISWLGFVATKISDVRLVDPTAATFEIAFASLTIFFPTMKNALVSLIAAGLVGVLAGCGTTNTKASRIKENQVAFDQLSPADQEVVRNGFIKIGYTQAMVYVALESPEKKASGPGVNEETWVYHNFYSSDGQSNMSGQKVVTKYSGSTGASGSTTQPAGAARGQNNTFSVEPDYTAEQIKTDSQIKVNVKFVDGKVAAIDVIRPN